jgi:hypothetical protein
VGYRGLHKCVHTHSKHLKAVPSSPLPFFLQEAPHFRRLKDLAHTKYKYYSGGSGT